MASKHAIAPIVEGHGEIQAVPILLRRILGELFDEPDVNVLRPIRIPRSKLIKPVELVRAISLADLKLNDVESEHRWVLVVFDADENAACELGPQISANALSGRPDVDVAVVLAVPEYETWFVASAESLNEYIDVDVAAIPAEPEASGAKKAWLQRHFRGRYTETIEQPALTARMNLTLCRTRSASFDKLCREVAKRL
jgi:hypothetical protein